MSCSSFLQLLKSKQYCGICKKIWHHSDGGDWVRYLTVYVVDFRSLEIMSFLMLYLAVWNSFLGMLWWLQCLGACWVCRYLQPTFQGEHAWFGFIPRSNHASTWELSLTCICLKDLEHSDYYCPDCKAKTTCKRPNLQKLEPKEKYAQRYITYFGQLNSLLACVLVCTCAYAFKVGLGLELDRSNLLETGWSKTSKLLCLTRFLWCAMAWKGHIFQNFICKPSILKNEFCNAASSYLPSQHFSFPWSFTTPHRLMWIGPPFLCLQLINLAYRLLHQN